MFWIGGRLREVPTYYRALTGKKICVLDRWSLTRGDRTWRIDCGVKLSCNIQYNYIQSHELLQQLVPYSFFCALLSLNQLKQFSFQIVVFAFEVAICLLKLGNSRLSFIEILSTLLQGTLKFVTKFSTFLGKTKDVIL